MLDLYKIALEDKYTTEIYDFGNGAVGFNFEINDDSLSQSPYRFSLHFEINPLRGLEIDANQLCEEEGMATIILNNSQFGVEYTLIKNGEELAVLAGTGEPIIYELDSSNLQLGINAFTIRSTSSICSTEEQKQQIELNMIEKPRIIYDAANNLMINSTGQAGEWFNYSELLTQVPIVSYSPDLDYIGAYSVKVSNDNCDLVSDQYLVSAVDHLELSSEIIISPNPTTDFISLSSGKNNATETSVIITDLSGRIYYEEVINMKNNRIKVKDYNSGVYIVLVSSSDGNSHKLRFVKI